MEEVNSKNLKRRELRLRFEIFEEIVEEGNVNNNNNNMKISMTKRNECYAVVIIIYKLIVYLFLLCPFQNTMPTDCGTANNHQNIIRKGKLLYYSFITFYML